MNFFSLIKNTLYKHIFVKNIINYAYRNNLTIKKVIQYTLKQKQNLKIA